METREKLSLLEEMLELDEGSLKEETLLSDINEWDSMTKLSLMVLLDDEFSKKVSGDEIKKLVSIKDIMNLMF